MNDQDRVLGASNELASFLDIMTDCADATSRWQKLVAFMARQGADQINYAVLNTLEHRREEAPVTQLSTMPDDWINFYLDERLASLIHEGAFAGYPAPAVPLAA